MRFKLLLVLLAGVFIVSCSGKKVVAVAETVTPKESVKEVVLTPELTEGKNLYENSCARCHKLYNPKDYTQEDWKPILTSMQRKAKLDNTQITSISNYITSQL